MKHVMKRGVDDFTVFLITAAFLAVVFLATWVRPETTAVGGVLLAAVFIFVAVTGWVRKWGSLSVVDLGVVTFMGYMLWRAGASPVAGYARSDQFLLLMAGGVWLLRPFVQWRREAIRKLWIVLMAVALFCNAAASGYQLCYDVEWGGFILRTQQASQYVSGFFSHYNYMANFCMLSALSVLGGVFSGKLVKSWRVMSGFVVLGNLVLLVMSHSRGAFIASAVGGVYFILLLLLAVGSRRSRKSILFGLGGVSFFCVLGSLVWLSFLGETRGWFSPANELADNGRGEFSALAVDQFLENPLLGDGAHSFEWRSLDLWPDDLWQGTATLDYVHQEYIQLLAEYGLVGLGLCLLCFFGFMGTQLYRISALRDKSGDRVWVISSCAAVVAFSVQCFFSFTAHIPALLLSVVFVATMGAAQGLRASSASGGCWMVIVRSSLLLAVGCWIGVLSMRELPAFVLYTQSNDTHAVEEVGSDQLLGEIASLAAVAEAAPNFRRYERLGLLRARAYQSEELSEAVRRESLALAIHDFGQAVALYPMAPMLNLNYGRVLTWDGRFGEAETYFEEAVRAGENREYSMNIHWHYAQACFDHGNALWFQRRTGEAYFYYLKSQKLLEKSIRYRFSPDMPKLLKQRIKLLESAGFVAIDPADSKRVKRWKLRIRKLITECSST